MYILAILSFLLLWASVTDGDNTGIKDNINLHCRYGIEFNDIQQKENNNEKCTLSIAGAPGTYEYVSLLVSTRNNNALVKINASDLKDNDLSIKHSNIDVRYVKEWYQGGTAMKGINADFERVLTPELLLKDDKLVIIDERHKRNYARIGRSGKYIDVSSHKIKEKAVTLPVEKFQISDANELKPATSDKAEQKKLLVKIKIPEEASSGTYVGSMTLFFNGGLEKNIEIELNVLNIYLPKTTKEFSIFYRGKLAHNNASISSEYKSEKQMLYELANMKEHGVSNPTIYLPKRPKRKVTDHSYVAMAIDYIEEILTIRTKAGIDNSRLYLVGWFNPGASNKKEVLTRKYNHISMLVEGLSKLGVSDVYVFGEDEARGKGFTSQIEAWRVAQRAGAKVFATGKKRDMHKTSDALDLGVVAHGTDINLARKYHANNKRVFSYANPQVGVEDPHIYRQNYGIFLWQSEYDGAMNYAYQHSFGFIWNDFDHKAYRDHVFAYPTEDGVIDTLAWEGFRQGVDDLMYIEALANAITKDANRNSSKECINTLEEGKRMLRDMKRLELKKLNLDVVRENIKRVLVGLNSCGIPGN